VREELVFNEFSHLKPVKRVKDWSDVAGFGSFDNGMCNRVLELLEMGSLRFKEVAVKRIAINEILSG